MSEVNSRDSFVLPAFTKSVFVVEKRQFLYDVIHYQIDVNCWLISNMLLERLTQLTNLRNIKSLVRVKFQHSSYDCF